jgi:hypothetical protein
MVALSCRGRDVGRAIETAGSLRRAASIVSSLHAVADQRRGLGPLHRLVSVE